MKPEDEKYLIDKLNQIEEDKREFMSAVTRITTGINASALGDFDAKVSLLSGVNEKITAFGQLGSTNYLSGITTNLINIVPKNIGLSVFDIPNFTLPPIEFPKIDYEHIEKNTNDNSNFGWTLTREISTFEYLDNDLLGLSLKDKDEYFYGYYSKNNWEHYRLMKESLLESVDPKWQDLMADCFDSFEQDKYRMVIPLLFSIIEGETAKIFKTNEYGGRLINFMKTQVSSEQDKFTQIAIYSLNNFMRKQLFRTHDFNKDRKPVINRNWILHGRDDPKHWRKVDALRLFNVLSTLQLVKEYKYN